jgi:hypothetical protein
VTAAGVSSFAALIGADGSYVDGIPAIGVDRGSALLVAVDCMIPEGGFAG